MTLTVIYEGKSKRVYLRDEESLIMEFKDEVTAGNGVLRAVAPGKGVLCARTSALLFKLLESRGIPTHFLDFDGYRRMTVRRLSMIPVEVVVRNYAYGSLVKRMPLYRVLQPLEPPLVEFHFKDDSLHDPLVLPEDVVRVGLLSEGELREVVGKALEVNEALAEFFKPRGLRLIDLKLEFGRDKSNAILVADELSGDTFRVLDERGGHLDKEVFRRGGGVMELLKAYAELAKRLGVEVSDVALPGRGPD